MSEGYVYQEVYELLCGLGSFDLQKIPISLLNDISIKRDKNYKTNIDKGDLYNINNISKEAFELYMSIDYEYLMTEEEKKFVDENA